MKTLAKNSRAPRALFKRALVLCCLVAPLAIVPIAAANASTASASDNFARANGSLGPNWADMADGGLTIVNQQVQGTNSAGYSGDIRTAEAYSSDQSSQVQLTSTQLSGGQWVGPVVRAQAGGADLYLGIYFWNGGSPELMLFVRDNGNWAQLGASPTSPLAAGTTLSLSATGPTLTFAVNGTTAITATDTTLTGGAPGLMAYGLPTAADWSGAGVTGTPPTTTTTSPSSTTTTTAPPTTTTTTTTTKPTTTTTRPTTTTTRPTTTTTTKPPTTTTTVPPTTTTTTPPTTTTTSPSSTTTTVPSSTTTTPPTTTTTTAGSGGPGNPSDNFARANGSLGPNWADMADGGLTIVNQQVRGTNSAGYSGDIRTAEAYSSDQSSQVQLTSTQLSGGQWVGPVVRAQAGGADLYLGIYFWNGGSPELMLFVRDNGNWAQLGASPTSPLAAGTTLSLSATGPTLTFAVNGTTAITATDTTLTGGAPGLMAYGLPTAADWSGAGVTGTPPTTTTTSPSSTTTTTVPPSTTTTTVPSSTTTTTVPPTTTTTVPPTTTTTVPPTTTTTVPPTTTTTTPPTTTTTSPSSTTTTVPSSTTTTPPTTTTTTAGSGGPGNPSDNFARANGSLGPNWADMADGGLTIVNQQVRGTNSAGYSGDIRTAEAYSSDQSSQVQLTSTQLSGGQWVGPVVRAQAGGADLYLGIYFWNGGSPELMLFVRDNGNWAQLGASPTSPLAAGTTLSLSATGPTLTFAVNGTTAITATDTTLTGGAPGLMAYGLPTAADWSGAGVTSSGGTSGPGTYSVSGTVSGLSGTVVLSDNGSDNLSVSASGTFTFPTLLADNASYNVSVLTDPTGQQCAVTNGAGSIADNNVTGVSVSCVAETTNSGSLQVEYEGAASGIQTYDFVSPEDGYGTQTLRVLQPTHPAAGVAHNFLFVLPVEAGLGNSYGDGLGTLQAMDAEDQYNLTIVEPTFEYEPWYANNPNDPNLQYESFMATDLVPWVDQNLATTGAEQNWLIGFSKSGIGGQDLLLKYPNLFAVAASWDFPADMSSYDQFGSSSANNYGTEANFAANYQLTQAFMVAHEAPFLTHKRIWIGGYSAFAQDMTDYGALLTSQGILYTAGPSQLVPHRWDSGWVPAAVAALYQDSLSLPPGP